MLDFLQLLPLLIQSLACHQVELQLSTMVTLNDLLVDQPKLLLSYVDDIIPNLLQLSVYKPSMVGQGKLKNHNIWIERSCL